MPESTFNLLDEPWIPVRWAPGAARPDVGGSTELLGLREVLLHSADITGLAVVEPPAHSALLRVLYALTARVTGLDQAGPGDWSERRWEVYECGRLSYDKVTEYLGKYRHRFFVFDPEGGRPWMQDPRLADQCDPAKSAGVNKLIVTRPAGNNHAWFRHGKDGDPDLPSVSEAVLHLLVWHYYGPSGRCSAREVNGVKSASASAGPLRTALSYHPEGENLFETLLAGLVPPSTTMHPADDLCPWEWDELRDPEAAAETYIPAGPCSRLTACSQHAVLLVAHEADPGVIKDAFITWAYRSGRIPRDDDYLIWQVSQQGNRYARLADSRRALWRDLDALLLKESAGEAQPQQPKVFGTAHEVPALLRVRALGFEQEGQAKDTQFVDASTPPVLEHAEQVTPFTAPAVAVLRILGETYGKRLERAVKRAWLAYKDDQKANPDTWVNEAAARYWPAAETEFWRRFRLLDRREEALDAGLDRAAARAAFLHLAERAFDIVTDSVTRTARGAKAVSNARIELYRGARKKKA